MPDTHTTSVDQQRLEKERIEDDGTVTLTRGGHAIHCLTVILGVPQTMHWFDQMQQRITGFVAAHSGMTEKRYTELMLHTGELVMDMGTVLDGRRAVKEKLIDELGGLSDALDWLHRAIETRE